LLGAIALARPAAASGPVFVLWDLSFLGLDETAARAIRSMLEGELRRVLGKRYLENAAVLTPEVRDAVESCGRTNECLAQAGGALGAHGVLIGTASVLGDAAGIIIKVVDTSTGLERANAKAMLRGDRGQMLEGLQGLVYELVDPARNLGALMVDIPIEGAVVVVDDQEVGATPLAEPVQGLAPGEHSLKVSSPLIKDFFSFFTVHPGKTTTVRVDVQEVQALQAQLRAAEEAFRVPVYRKWWFWTAIAVGAGAIAGTSVLLLTNESGGGPPRTTAGTVDFR
jgi:hypothetical protein